MVRLNLARSFRANIIRAQPEPNFGLVGLAQRVGLKLPTLITIDSSEGNMAQKVILKKTYCGNDKAHKASLCERTL